LRKIPQEDCWLLSHLANDFSNDLSMKLRQSYR
jgi:hypothetical protein